MNKIIKRLTACVIFTLILLLFFVSRKNNVKRAAEKPPVKPHPMAIESLRNREFQGGDLVMEIGAGINLPPANKYK
jgi:hypothetical protein